MLDRTKILKNIITGLVILNIVTLLFLGILKLYQIFGSNSLSQDNGTEQRTRELMDLDKKLDEIRVLDSDLDGLSDTEEQQLGTNPLKVDTDDDGVLDKNEIEIWNTNPLNSDTDNDGYKDGYEIRQGQNPLGEGSLQ